MIALETSWHLLTALWHARGLIILGFLRGLFGRR
jgi:hypothetical protein